MNGDTSKLPLVRKLAELEPEMLISIGDGDLAAAAEAEWLKVATGTNLVQRAGAQLKLGALRKSLGASSASALELLLIDRVVVCWLQLHDADLSAARHIRQSAAAGRVVVDADTFHQRRQHQTQRRYLAAIRALAQVRKLLAPPAHIVDADFEETTP